MNSLRIQDSSLNGVRVFLRLWTLVEFSTFPLVVSWILLNLYVPDIIQHRFGFSHFSGISDRRNLSSPTPLTEGLLLCIPDLSSSRSNTVLVPETVVHSKRYRLQTSRQINIVSEFFYLYKIRCLLQPGESFFLKARILFYCKIN